MQLAIIAQPVQRTLRDRAFMVALADEYACGDLTVVDDGPALTDQLIHAAERIVLLWPDGDGLGWSPIERRVWRAKRPDAAVSVLNGRRRAFALTKMLWLRFQARRLFREWRFGHVTAP